MRLTLYFESLLINIKYDKDSYLCTNKIQFYQVKLI